MARRPDGSVIAPSVQAQEEARARREQEQFAEQSWFSFLNPLNWGIGNLFIFAAIAIGGYFLATTDKGKEMLSGLIDMLPESWRGKAAGALAFLGVENVGQQYIIAEAMNMTAEQAREKMQGTVPDAVAAVIAKDDATWKRVVGHVRDAGGNILDPISAPVLMRLMTQEPQMVQDMLRALPKPATANAAGNEKVMAAIRTIAGDPTMLATLLGREHRANTLAALEIVSPVALPPGQFGAIITAIGIRNDRPTAGLSGLIGRLLADGTAPLPELVRFVATDAEARAGLKEYLSTPGASTLPKAMRTALAQAATATPAELRALADVEQDYASRGGSFLGLAGRIQDSGALVGALLNGEHRANLTPNIGRLGVMFEERATHTTGTEQLMAKFLGTRSDDNRAVNMKALVQFFDRIGSSEANQQNSAATYKVLSGLVGMLSGDKAAARTLDAGQVAAFFQNPQNSQAFGLLLRSIDTRHLAPEQRRLVATLKTHWGNQQQGLAEMLAERESVALLLNPGTGKPIQIKDLNGFEHWYASSMPSWMPYAVPGKIAENLDGLGDIQQALNAAGVVRSAAPVQSAALSAPSAALPALSFARK